MKKRKKLFALLLSLAMILTFMPLSMMIAYAGTPALPGATVDNIKKESVKVFTYEGGEVVDTGATAKPNAAVRFTAEDVEADTYNYYKDWACDFKVTFDKDIPANTIGLYGAYTYLGGDDYDIGFVVPQAIKANEPIYLIDTFVQAAGLNGVTVKYSKVKEMGTFDCGMFNLSEVNYDNSMRVELVMYKDSIADAEPIASTTYEFNKNMTWLDPMPNATVTEKTAPTGVNVHTSLNQTLVGIVTPQAAYNFVPDENSDESSTAYKTYEDWYCDFVVSFDEPMSANSFGLYGAYGTYGNIAFLWPKDIAAGDEVYLLESALGVDTHLTYREVVKLVQSFDCGAFNLSDSNTGKTMTVKLNMFRRDSNGNVIDVKTLGDKTYIFTDKTYWTVNNTDYYYVPTGLDTTSGKVLNNDRSDLVAQSTAGPHFMPKESKYIVSLVPENTEGSSAPAKLSGGGPVNAGETTTVIAPALSGYSFVGWYEGSYASGNQKSTNRTYTFRPTADVTMVAVYEAITSFNLRVTGAAYDLQDEHCTSTVTRAFAAGTSVTLSYTANDNFLYWVNASDNIVSTDKNYTFTIVNNTELKAISTDSGSEDPVVTVAYMNAYNQVISTGKAADQYDLEELEPGYQPTKMGYTFKNWAITEKDNEEATAANILKYASTDNPVLHIAPSYTKDASTYSLTVIKVDASNNNEKTRLTTLTTGTGNKIVLTAERLSQYEGWNEGDTIKYWSLDGTNYTPASYDKQYTAIYGTASENTLYVVVNGDDPNEAPVVNITQMYGTPSGQKHKLSTTVKWQVPSGNTIVETGFAYGTNANLFGENVAERDDNLKLDQPSVYKHLTGMTDRSATYTFSATARSADLTLYIRGFVTYIDKSGHYQTIYTPIYSGSYNSLKNNN